MNWFRLTLLDGKYERVMNTVLWLTILFCVAILLAYNAGRNDEAKEQELTSESLSIQPTGGTIISRLTEP